MKLVLDHCVVVRDGKTTRISVVEALKNRREIMGMPRMRSALSPTTLISPTVPVSTSNISHQPQGTAGGA